MNERFRTLWSSTVFTLVLIGIAGLSWSAFQDNGWVEKLFGVVWEAELRHPLLLIPTIAGTLFMAVYYLRGGFKPGKGKVSSALFIYGLMAAGLYYAYRWLLA